MFIHENNITEYIPQRPPIVMIDGLLEVKDHITRTGLQIAADNLFVEDGKLMPPGLLENMAQTAAARAGYVAQQENTPVLIGFIGAVKDFEVFELPPVGSFIETITEIQSQVFNATMIAGKVLLNGKVMAQCELKIFINP
jgi:predicted hotdog family 3-hydroxylacyl-ACP dehydratase